MLASALVTLQLADSAFPSGAYTLSHGLEGYAQEHAIEPARRPGAAARPAVPLDRARRRDRAGARAPRGSRRRLGARGGGRPAAAREQADPRAAPGLAADRPPDAAALPRGVPVGAARAVRRGGRRRRHAGHPGGSRRGRLRRHGGAAVEGGRGRPVRLRSSFAGAALRLRLADHRSAQMLLRGAAPAIEQATAAALERGIEDVGGCAPFADVMSARHERAEAKLFAS